MQARTQTILFQGSRRRKNDKHTKGKKVTGESAGAAGAAESESSEQDTSNSGTKSDEEESSCVSDDSLEVVIVKRSLEKTCEKIISSGRKSKTPREDSKSSKTSDEKSSKSSKKRSDAPVAKPRQKGLSVQQKVFDGDSTSQDTVEQVTVTVDVHEGGKQESEDIKSKMEDILEKADELQSALLTKAADLKKDVEEMRHQMATQHKSSESDEKKDTTTTETKSGTFDSTYTTESSSIKEESPKIVTEEKRKSLETSCTQQQEAPKAVPEHFTTDSDQVEVKATEIVTEDDGTKKTSSITVEVTETKKGPLTRTQVIEEETKLEAEADAKKKTTSEVTKKDDSKSTELQTQSSVTESSIPGTKIFYKSSITS